MQEAVSALPEAVLGASDRQKLLGVAQIVAMAGPEADNSGCFLVTSLVVCSSVSIFRCFSHIVTPLLVCLFFAVCTLRCCDFRRRCDSVLTWLRGASLHDSQLFRCASGEILADAISSRHIPVSC